MEPQSIEIVPSILSADFARLAEEIGRVERAGVRMLHVDVMDGHVVPNLTLGPPVVESIRKITKLTLDVHLMIENADLFVPAFIQAGADQLTVHYEACRNLDRTVRFIQSEGARAGGVINPATPVAVLGDILEVADYILVMSVNPGFRAQKFIPKALTKIRALDRRRKELGLQLPIEIDGGGSLDNVGEIVRAGCNWLVAGSSVFHSEDPATTVNEMQRLARDADSVVV